MGDVKRYLTEQLATTIKQIQDAEELAHKLRNDLILTQRQVDQLLGARAVVERALAVYDEQASEPDGEC